MKKITLDFSGIKAPEDLNGTVYTLGEVNKTIGNLLFVHGMSIEIDTIARSLHGGEKTEVSNGELKTILELVGNNPAYIPICQKVIINHIQELIKESDGE